MEREVELLTLRATPLLFGIFGHLTGSDGQRIIRFGGSGIFIAPFFALTARHVSRDLLKLDWRGERLPNKKEYFEPQHSSALFQVLDPFGAKPSHAIWQVDRTWDTSITDISFMQVSAQSSAAIEMQTQMPSGFFEWALMPPPVGAQVVMLGYPKTEISPVGDMMTIGIKYVRQVGQVSEVHEIRRDRGMMNFPCFHIDKPIDEGFSGGPVFWDDKLCGIVSSGSLDGGTYAATLWPLCLMECEYPDLGSLGGRMVFGDLFESNVLQSGDWRTLRNRISRRHDDNDIPYAHIENGAA